MLLSEVPARQPPSLLRTRLGGLEALRPDATLSAGDDGNQEEALQEEEGDGPDDAGPRGKVFGFACTSA